MVDQIPRLPHFRASSWRAGSPLGNGAQNDTERQILCGLYPADLARTLLYGEGGAQDDVMRVSSP